MSMKVGRDPIHWTLNGVASLRVIPSSSAARVEVELQQGGIPEHAERPFVGVRHDRDARMLEHAGPLRRQLREAVPFHHLPRADQSALLAEAAVEACLRKPLPVRERAPREAAEHAAGMVEDAGIGVAERPGLEAERGARRHGAAYRGSCGPFFRRTAAIRRCQ